MVNPILQAISKTGGNAFQALPMIKSIMSGNPSAAIQAEMQNNKRFADFVKSHQGKSIDDLIAETGIDANTIQSFINNCGRG